MALIAFLAAFVVAVAFTPLAGGLARRLDILDHPGPLKTHAQPVPYLGGLAVFVAVAAAGGWARPAFLVPLGLALALGVVDDRRSVAPGGRLVCELGVGAVAATVMPTSMGVPLGPAAVVITVVVLLNAVNLIDGIDALASGVALASALGFAALLSGADRVAALALAGALAGFLVHNRPPARIYLGDGGAYAVGTALALLLTATWAPGRRSGAAIGALLLVAVPLGEVVVAVVRRWRARRPLFLGDRSHVYDQLADRGWTVPRVSLACAGAQACLSALGVAAGRLGGEAAAAVVVVVGALIVAGAAVSGFMSPSGPRRLP